MNFNDTTGDILLARLKQMGAHESTNITSRLYYITFKIENEFEVSYVYNINKKDQYFLQRVAPYPLPKGLFSTHEEIIDFIAEDIKKFQNATHSKNFKRFLEINHSLAHIENDIERLFLNYNVPGEYINTFHRSLHDLEQSVQQARSKSTHILIKHE